MRILVALLVLLALAGCSYCSCHPTPSANNPHPLCDGYYRAADGRWGYAQTECWTLPSGKIGWIQRSGFGDTPAEAVAACKQTGGLGGSNGTR